MRRKLDTARPCPRYVAALSLATAVTCLATVTGCSGDGPKPEDQRAELVAFTQTLVSELTDGLGLVDVTVGDDGSDPVECAGGRVQYRYAVEATTDKFAAHGDDIDAAIDDADGLLLGILVGYWSDDMDFTSTETDDPPGGPMHVVYTVEDGDQSGATLTYDLAPADGGSMGISIVGTTTCG